MPTLATGTHVTTGKNDINYVVTEYGVAQLRGKSARQRCDALIAIAHPDFRGELRAAATHALDVDPSGTPVIGRRPALAPRLVLQAKQDCLTVRPAAPARVETWMPNRPGMNVQSANGGG